MSADARSEILRRLRAALANQKRAPDPINGLSVPAAVTQADGDRLALARLFAQKLQAVDGNADVLASADDVTRRVAELIVDWDAGVRDAVVLCWDPAALPVPGFRNRLRDAGVRLLVPGDLHDARSRADAADAAVGLTGVAAAFATTGSVLLASGRGTSRAASLLPFRHIVLIPFSRIYPSVEEWLAERRRRGDVKSLLSEAGQVTFVTGPSKSADIELNLTLGVHGPRVVHALVFEDG